MFVFTRVTLAFCSRNLTLDEFVRECYVITDTCDDAMDKYLKVTTVNLDARRCFTFTTSKRLISPLAN